MRRLPIVILSLILIMALIAGCGINAQNPVIEEDENSSEHGFSPTGDEPSQSEPSEDKEDSRKPVDSDLENPEASFVIVEPEEGQLVETGQELVIKGKTRIKNFRVEVEDGHNILGEASVELKDKSDGFVEFETVIELDSHTSPSGMIIFVLEGEDGKRQEGLILPVRFE